MSMMKTLARVAAAVILAKAQKGTPAGRSPEAQGLLADLTGAKCRDPDAINRVLRGDGVNGLGAILEMLSTDARMQGEAPSDLDNLIGGLSDVTASQRVGQPSFGTVLRSYFSDEDAEPLSATPDQEAAAQLLVKALLQAARSDGLFDPAQRAALMYLLQDVTADARSFVAAELDRPVDAAHVALQVPPWLESQVYAVSLLGSNAVAAQKASYLRDLASHMAVGPDHVNMIHDSFGVPRLT